MNRTFSVFRSIGLARVPYFYSIGKPNSPLMAEMGVCFQIASGRFGLIDGLKKQTCTSLCMWLVVQNQGLLPMERFTHEQMQTLIKVQRFQETVVSCTRNSQIHASRQVFGGVHFITPESALCAT